MFWFNFPEAIAEVARDIKLIIRMLITQKGILNIMSINLQKVLFVVKENADLKAELATAKQDLADALGNDAASAQAVADAQAEADAAKAEAQIAKDAVAPLQALADADIEEDTALTEALASVELPV